MSAKGELLKAIIDSANKANLERSIMPAPQRFFDPEDKAYKPFLERFDYQPGGRYLEMGPDGPRDVTGEYPVAANISVGPDGKPKFKASQENLEAPPDTKGVQVKTNLFKKKAGWKWTKPPKGYDPDPDGSFPLISVEARGKHYYALETDFPEGVDLSRYASSSSEPRLRPTRKGDVTLGKKVGEISVRGKKHPVYDKAVVKTTVPIAAAGTAGLSSEEAEANPLLKIIDSGRKAGIEAYHGSPYDFDKFQTEAIGTGEGAQAYGRGLYFAESEDVARGYRDSLTKLRKDGTTPAPEDSIANSYEQEYGLSGYENFNNTTLDDVIETISDDAVETSADVNGNVRYEFSDGSGYLITQDGKVIPSGEVTGRMYEVNIDADPKDLLDWDKPLLEQPALLSKIDDRYGDHEIVLAQLGVDIRSNPTGMDLADALNMRRGNSSGPPPLLQEIGIKGVKYADANTRHKSSDKQSKNFVIFDDRLIDISRKYGVTIPVAAAMLSQTEEAEAGFLTTPANLIRIGMLKPQSAQNPSAVKSAMTKYDKAMRDSKAFRFREKIRADVENKTQSIDIGERNILDIADLVGKVGVPVAGDTSVTGKILETIGGLDLDSPVGVEGGSNFGLRYKPRGFGWASMLEAAKKKQDNFALAANETGMQPVGIFNAMGRDSVAFSTPPAETMLQQALALPIKKSDIKAFDDELRKLRPNWVGLNHPGAMDQIMGRGDYPQKGAGKLRSAFVEEMSKARHRDVGFPIKEDVYSEILQPEIADLPIGSSGFSMFDAQPAASLISGSPHQSYDTVIPGNYIGGLDQSVPARVMFPKTFADLDQRTNKAGELFTESQKTGSLVMNPKLYEVFDDQWADSVYKYQKEQGKKQRGAANPALLAAAAATGGGILGAGQVEGGVDKIAGIADAAANAAAGMVAPILSAPGAVARYLGDRYVPGVDFSAEDIARERQNTEQFFDYQPRTELGQQYSDQGMQALGGLLAPVVDASQGSNIIDLLKSGYNKMGKKEKELTKALLDMSPI